MRRLRVMSVVGGTNVRSEQTKFATNPPDILIATPGRLIDHLENTPRFAALVARLRTFVLDEADREPSAPHPPTQPRRIAPFLPPFCFRLFPSVVSTNAGRGVLRTSPTTPARHGLSTSSHPPAHAAWRGARLPLQSCWIWGFAPRWSAF